MAGHTDFKVLERGVARVLVSERGARVMGIFPGGSTNILWVNPRLREVLERGEWNMGGLRIWLSPERNFFYERPEAFEGWFCPPTIDPGSYKFTGSSRSQAELEGRVSAVDRLQDMELEATIRREVKLVDEDRILIRESLLAKYPGPINLWALAQVNPGPHGTVIVPVRPGAEPVHYFGPIPQDRLVVRDNHVAFKIDGLRVCKLGVRPEDSQSAGAGVIAYVSEIGGDSWSLLVMRTWDAPRSQDECLDPPKADPAGPRGSVQSYNSGPEAGPERFGEAELHFRPAVGVSGYKVSTVEYEVLFAAGPRKTVLDRLAASTGVKKPFIF